MFIIPEQANDVFTVIMLSGNHLHSKCSSKINEKKIKIKMSKKRDL